MTTSTTAAPVTGNATAQATTAPVTAVLMTTEQHAYAIKHGILDKAIKLATINSMPQGAIKSIIADIAKRKQDVLGEGYTAIDAVCTAVEPTNELLSALRAEMLVHGIDKLSLDLTPTTFGTHKSPVKPTAERKTGNDSPARGVTIVKNDGKMFSMNSLADHVTGKVMNRNGIACMNALKNTAGFDVNDYTVDGEPLAVWSAGKYNVIFK